MTTLKDLLPKERKPKLVEKNNCIYLKNIKYIHDYKTYNKKIIEPFKRVVKSSHIDKFINTCDHMFNIVGYGVFIFILEGKIHTYQVFANTTSVKPGSECITKKMIKSNNKTTRKNKKGKPTKDKKRMGFHYCMFKAYDDWWKSETDKSIYYHLIETCLKDTNITTCFFLNLNTFPVLYNRKCNQYILHQDVCKNNAHINNHYIPVLSGATTKDHFDKCIVYPDTWEIITRKRFGAFSTNNFIDAIGKINTDWSTKKDAIIFRGENKTCYQLDTKKNERIKVINIINNMETNLKKDIALINLKPKDFYIDDKMNTNNKDDIPSVNLAEKMPMEEQSNYKYVLNIDGHANAWRLCFELSYNSCIILFLSKYYSWFYDRLKHMENVYIIDVNGSNLDKEILNCLTKLEGNDNIGKKIAKGARKLYDEIINMNYVKKYMIDLLTDKDFDIIFTF